MLRSTTRSALPLLIIAALLGACGGSGGHLPQDTTAKGPPAAAAPERSGTESAPADAASENTGADDNGADETAGDEIVAASGEVSTAPALPPVNAALLDSCDAPRSIVIAKAARRMELRCGDEVAARFPVSLGFAPAGHKHHEGDGRTPEGRYYITTKFRSSFHRSLELSYPNIQDAKRGLAEGQISQAQHNHIVRAINSCKRPPQTTPLGSLLQIHGGGGGEEIGDWTLGCVATDNPAIEAVYAFHKPGCDANGPRTPVIINP